MVTVLPERRLVFLLAARADCSIKTAGRALVEGVDAIKGANLRDRLRQGLEDLHSATIEGERDVKRVRAKAATR